MYCESCGNKIREGHKFCAKCGVKAPTESGKVGAVASDERWWHRLLKVSYILLYLPLPLLLLIVWSINATTYSYYGVSEDNSGAAFWYSIIALVIYMTIVRLIKVAVLYITMGIRPQWNKEFRRLF